MFLWIGKSRCNSFGLLPRKCQSDVLVGDIYASRQIVLDNVLDGFKPFKCKHMIEMFVSRCFGSQPLIIRWKCGIYFIWIEKTPKTLCVKQILFTNNRRGKNVKTLFLHRYSSIHCDFFYIIAVCLGWRMIADWTLLEWEYFSKDVVSNDAIELNAKS